MRRAGGGGKDGGSDAMVWAMTELFRPGRAVPRVVQL